MDLLFTNCFTGVYVGGEGDGISWGGYPDVLMTNVPEYFMDDYKNDKKEYDYEVEFLFNQYTIIISDGYNGDEKDFEVKLLSEPYKGEKKPKLIPTRDDLIHCCEEFVQISYNDFCDWF